MSATRRRKPSKRSGSRKRPASDATFWAAKGAARPDVDRIQPAEDPSVLVRSLGPAPLPGRETIAEHYFATVYDKAAAFAIALAATADLLDLDEPDELDELDVSH